MHDLGETQTCVIGAGVVGLAVARRLAAAGDLLVLEAGPRYGEGISSRNSEVIHAGIYYPEGSLKAELCVRGKHMLYEYCRDRGIAHQCIGKLLVATSPGEEEALMSIQARASANGVELEPVSGGQIRKLEPAVAGTAGLLSPSTGVISAHDWMTALLGDAEASGANLALRCRVTGVEVQDPGFRVNCRIEGEDYFVTCRNLVNAAGLGAQEIASLTEGLDNSHIPPLYLCRGTYFNYSGRSPFARLIYPVPEAGTAGLGVHATIDVGGQVKFGPDVEYINQEDYQVNSERLESSIAAIRRYFPTLEEHRLSPGYAGIRPKLQGPGEPAADFVIQGSDVHRVPGLVNLFGIESPGLTSSLAIAETVSAALAIE